MSFQEALSKSQDAITVNRVYGEPYERNGVTVIPAAKVAGGGGAGGGEDPSGGGPGSGGGFGIGARPVGAYVIKGDQVRWQPTVDVSRVLAQLTLAALGLALVRRRVRPGHRQQQQRRQRHDDPLGGRRRALRGDRHQCGREVRLRPSRRPRGAR